MRYLFEESGFEDLQVEWLEGYFGTVSYELAVASRALQRPRLRFASKKLRGMSALAARADLRYRVTSVGHPKNYTVIARG